LAVPPPKRDAVANANESRLTAVTAHVLMSELPALWITVDAQRNQAANFLVGEDEVMGFDDAAAKLLAGPLHQLDEI
jgi:hypothetical protein